MVNEDDDRWPVEDLGTIWAPRPQDRGRKERERRWWEHTERPASGGDSTPPEAWYS